MGKDFISDEEKNVLLSDEGINKTVLSKREENIFKECFLKSINKSNEIELSKHIEYGYLEQREGQIDINDYHSVYDIVFENTVTKLLLTEESSAVILNNNNINEIKDEKEIDNEINKFIASISYGMFNVLDVKNKENLNITKTDNINVLSNDIVLTIFYKYEEIKFVTSKKQILEIINTYSSIYDVEDNKLEEKNDSINVKRAIFENLSESDIDNNNDNLGLIIDVPLDVSVILGRTKKSIQEVLEFGNGTLIELDKLAEEPLEILINGKKIALGEVVVVDENFGIRITEIVSNIEKIKSLK